MKNVSKNLYKYSVLIIVILIIIFVFRGLVSSVNTSYTSNSSSNVSSEQNNICSFEEATIVRVVDGDTVIVNVSDKEKRVRMIGVDTPESVNPDESKNTEEGKIASVYTKSQLKAGQVVYLEYDKEKYDDYGRTLAYIWLSKDVNTKSIKDISQYMYNAILLKNGYAKILTIKPNCKYQNYFQLISFGGEINQ